MPERGSSSAKRLSARLGLGSPWCSLQVFVPASVVCLGSCGPETALSMSVSFLLNVPSVVKWTCIAAHSSGDCARIVFPAATCGGVSYNVHSSSTCLDLYWSCCVDTSWNRSAGQFEDVVEIHQDNSESGHDFEKISAGSSPLPILMLIMSIITIMIWYNVPMLSIETPKPLNSTHLNPKRQT